MNVKECADNFLRREARLYDNRESRRQSLLLEIVPKIQKLLKCYPSVNRAYLFGSILRKGDLKENSDVDIAVEGLAGEHYFKLWRELEEELKISVDLRIITEILAKTIYLTGQKIYDRENSSSYQPNRK